MYVGRPADLFRRVSKHSHTSVTRSENFFLALSSNQGSRNYRDFYFSSLRGRPADLFKCVSKHSHTSVTRSENFMFSAYWREENCHLDRQQTVSTYKPYLQLCFRSLVYFALVIQAVSAPLINHPCTLCCQIAWYCSPEHIHSVSEAVISRFMPSTYTDLYTGLASRP